MGDTRMDRDDQQHPAQQQHLIALAYLLCGFTDLDTVGSRSPLHMKLAEKVFVQKRVEEVLEREVEGSFPARQRCSTYREQFVSGFVGSATGIMCGAQHPSLVSAIGRKSDSKTEPAWLGD
jgi:hypothetical protein